MLRIHANGIYNDENTIITQKVKILEEQSLEEHTVLTTKKSYFLFIKKIIFKLKVVNLKKN